MSTLIFKTPSALNVEVPGTAGSFSVSRQGHASEAIEVQYLLTHVALGGGGGQQQLLDMLAPVREVFDIDQLGFDEIMQRDIDDSRVSMELIPYLLEHRNTGLVKLFPPIVVVVLPLKETSRKPAHRYAPVSTMLEEEVSVPGYKWSIMTAGAPGREQFELRRLLRPDDTIDPPHSKLKLAQSNCALAIVDGQHRAMALLALYRNLTGGWTDAKRQVYQQYYKVWSDEEIRGFDLTQLHMPMIICTFPQLDENFAGDMDVIRAARRVFLDLNKNAKKVSDSRNKLLDDQDMVSECLRTVLANVKAYDVNSPTPLRIENIELDQSSSRSVISSPIAITGVSHLYYIAEHLLFYTSFTQDVGARRAFLARSRRLHDAYTRLGLSDHLTTEEQNDNSRHNYTDKVKTAVEGRWDVKYGKAIELIFAKFHPFAAHANASLQTRERLEAENDTKLRSLLFDGQASSQTFDEFRNRLELKARSEPEWATPALRAIMTEVKAQWGAYNREVDSFRHRRAVKFVLPIAGSKVKVVRPAADEVDKAAEETINRLYGEVFSSIAFQAALVITLVEAFEAAHDASAGNSYQITAEDVECYITDLESLFKPTTVARFTDLAATFFEVLEEKDGVFEKVPSAANFSGVVMPNEMKPDEWPKHRYLILELWNPEDPDVRAIVNRDREAGRAAILKSAYRRALVKYCEDHQMAEKDVSSDAKIEVLAGAVRNFEQFLRYATGKSVSLAQMAKTMETQVGGIIADTLDVEDEDSV